VRAGVVVAGGEGQPAAGLGRAAGEVDDHVAVGGDDPRGLAVGRDREGHRAAGIDGPRDRRRELGGRPARGGVERIDVAGRRECEQLAGRRPAETDDALTGAEARDLDRLGAQGGDGV
jgi:hypothetical protein